MRNAVTSELEVCGKREQVEILGQVGNFEARKRMLGEGVGRGFKSDLTQDAPPWEKPSLC